MFSFVLGIFFFCADLTESQTLHSLFVLGGEAEEVVSAASESGVFFRGIAEPEGLKTLLTDKLGKSIDPQLVAELEHDIARSYQAQGDAFYFVTVPDQEITKGVLAVQVRKAKAGKVSYSDTKWFSQKTLQKEIPVNSGEELNREKLLNDAAWSNRNPFHYTEINFVPGTDQGTTDVQFMTQERFPLRVYAGADNTGIDATDQTRLFAGFNWGNAFGVGDLMTFQFTASPDFHRFLSYFGRYDCYLPCKHILSLFGGYAQIYPKISGFRSEGKDIQGSLYYTIPLKPLYTPFLQDISVGLDYKSINSNLFFQDVIPVMTKTAQITEISLLYQMQDTLGDHTFSAKAELHYSPFQWLPDQTKARYDVLRPGASVEFIYGKGLFSELYRMNDVCSLSLLLRGQGASGALLPSEQFGLGGYETIRGYKEYAVLVDNAFCANLEFRFLTHPGWKKNDLEWIAFFDYGWGHNWKSLYGVPPTQYLLGVGPGVRWRTGSWLLLHADYGFQLHKVYDNDGFGRFHLRAVISY